MFFNNEEKVMRDRNRSHSSVWIEIEYTDSNKKNHANAEKFTKLLHKLGIAKYQRVEFNEEKFVYELFDQADGFLELADQGHYFNLDFLIK
jgi:hypothetical protein